MNRTSNRAQRRQGAKPVKPALPVSVTLPVVNLGVLATAARIAVEHWLRFATHRPGTYDALRAVYVHQYDLCDDTAKAQVHVTVNAITAGALIAPYQRPCDRCGVVHETPKAYRLRDANAPWMREAVDA